MRYKKLTALIRERKEQEETSERQDEETADLDVESEPKCEDSMDPRVNED